MAEKLIVLVDGRVERMPHPTAPVAGRQGRGSGEIGKRLRNACEKKALKTREREGQT